MSRDSQTVVSNGGELTLERVFDAPREVVFKAFTESDRLMQWWGPREWPLAVSNLDLRVGGDWHYCMKGPNGEEAWGKAIYREIDPPSRLVYEDAFSDAAGNVDSNLPVAVTSVDFIAHEGKTKLVSKTVYPSAEALSQVIDMGMVEGVSETWDRLDEYLAATG